MLNLKKVIQNGSKSKNVISMTPLFFPCFISKCDLNNTQLIFKGSKIEKVIQIEKSEKGHFFSLQKVGQNDEISKSLFSKSYLLLPNWYI